jgi:hypothetical protein
MSYNYKISDLKFRINNLVPQKICEKLINIFKKYPELHIRENSYKFKRKEKKEDNYSCFNLSSIENPNEDVTEAFEICRLVFDACLKVPKLYEGSCIRDLVAGGLKLEPKESGFKDIEKFLSLLGA